MCVCVLMRTLCVCLCVVCLRVHDSMCTCVSLSSLHNNREIKMYKNGCMSILRCVESLVLLLFLLLSPPAAAVLCC